MARRPTSDSRAEAEKAFKAATTKPAELPAKATALPHVNHRVTLRVDPDVLDFFPEEGPGWQDRMNAGWRKAAGK